MRLGFALLVLLAASHASAQGTGTIAGQVLEDDGVTALIWATVSVDSTALRVTTDVDGNYRIIGVPAGTYTVTASYLGYTSQTQASVDVKAGYTRQLNFTLSLDPDVKYIVWCGNCGPPISADPYASRFLSGKDIERMPINR